MSRLLDLIRQERERREVLDGGDQLREFMVNPKTGEMMYISNNQLQQLLREIDGKSRGLWWLQEGQEPQSGLPGTENLPGDSDA
jgi:hypothetical protein